MHFFKIFQKYAYPRLPKEKLNYLTNSIISLKFENVVLIYHDAMSFLHLFVGCLNINSQMVNYRDNNQKTKSFDALHDEYSMHVNAWS